MQPPSRELIERLAAEFVLGTLRGPARTRFERWVGAGEAAHQVLARAAVRRWEDRLVHLADDVPPVEPSPRVWREIARRTRPPSARRDWQPWALAASVALVAIATWLWSGRDAPIAWQMAAELRDSARPAALWRIEVDGSGTRLRALADSPYAIGPDAAHELWALAGDGSAPVSLGLLPQRGAVIRTLTPAQRAAFAVARQLAVSREPAGGSPTGAPTGPVLIVSERTPRV